MERRKTRTFTSNVLVVYGREALLSERKAAELLARCLAERCGARTCAVDDQKYDPENWDALVLVGHPDRHLVAAALMASYGVRRPTDDRPGPEGYVVRRVGPTRPPTVIIAAQGRGCVYGVGAFLRAVDLTRPGQVGIPYLHLENAPAFPVRGSDLKFWQEQRATELGMGDWSLAQWEAQVADLAAWGFNLVRRRLFDSAFDTWLNEQEWMVQDGPGKMGWELEKQLNQTIHDYGLEVGVSYPPNTIAQAVTRDDWHPGSFWPRLACPTLPAARDRILYERLLIFKELKYVDHLFVPPYKVGGCACENCRPWARTYLELVGDLAKYLHRYHPQAQVWISNQGFSASENEWLWETLKRDQPEWMRVLEWGANTYGSLDSEPGSARRKTGQRFYPVVGAVARTLQETVRRLPIDWKLVLRPDVTHTFQPQYGLEHIDPALFRLHTLESPFARPLGYHEVFRSSAGASAGVTLYSEGIYDDLNKALWAGWMWSPNLTPWDATLTYTRYWFGENAAQLIAEAVLLSEANWETPLKGNEQIEQVTLLLDQAKMRVPPHLQEDNWRWTMWRLRGLLDLLAQRKWVLAEEARQAVHVLLADALQDPHALAERVRTALDMLDLRQQEAHLEWLKGEIRDLDNLLHYQIGVRLPAVSNLDAELSNLAWERHLLRAALKAFKLKSNFPALRQAVAFILDYENPGPGGFYDDCGHIGRDPHFVSGHRLPWTFGLDPENRPSANTLAVGFGDGDDIVFVYRGLDPEVDYTVQLTLVCPDPGENPEILSPGFDTMGLGTAPCAGQRLYASGFLVHDDLTLPHRTAKRFSFDLPRQAFGDGRMELRFVRARDSHIAAVSEIWIKQTNS